MLLVFVFAVPVRMKNRGDFGKLDTMQINFGPQHPAAHGVLRLILEMTGEVAKQIHLFLCVLFYHWKYGFKLGIAAF